MTLDLEARRQSERRRNFYALGVITILSTLLGWGYQQDIYRFYSAKSQRMYFTMQIQKANALLYDLIMLMRGSIWKGGKRMPLLLNQQEEQRLRERLKRYANGAYRHVLDIVIVAIDDETEEWLKDQKEPITPIRRKKYAELVRRLDKAGAKTIAFDIHMDAPSLYGEDDDKAFADAIKKAGNVLLPCLLMKQRGGADTVTQPPHQPLYEWAIDAGLINMTTDPDRAIRAATVAGQDAVGWRPSLGTLAAAYWLGITDQALEKQLQQGQFNEIPLPLVTYVDDELGFEGIQYMALLLNFVGAENSFRYVPMKDVLSPKGSNLTDADLKRLFEGKIVFVGFTSKLAKDFFVTPFSANFPGVEIHATLAQMLLSGKFLKLMPLEIVHLLSLLFIGVVTVLVFWLRPLRAFLPLLFLASAYLYSALFALDRWLLVMPIAPTLMAMAFSFVFVTAYLHFVVERHAHHIRQRFGRFMAPSVLETIIVASEEELVRPRRVEATVLFTDLRGFTTISETRSPEEAAAVLNEHFEVMTEIIDRHEGTISKFIGDGMMALFGIPIPHNDHAIRAVQCAVEMQLALEELRQRFTQRGLPDLFMRVGIHTGEMVFGAIGSQRQSDLTVIGDTVNVASRLESMNKEFGSKILISESTYEKAVASGANIVAETVGEVAVRGRIHPIRIYKVLGVDEQFLPEAPATVARSHTLQNSLRYNDGNRN